MTANRPRPRSRRKRAPGHTSTQSAIRAAAAGKRECRSVLDMFIEMKDTSELMIDLAYSSVLYNNKEIAEEVITLEDRVDELNNKIQEDAICEVLDDKNVFKALAMIRLANSIEAIADSARAIADVVLRDIEPHPILKMSIRQSDTSITAVKIKRNSIIAEKTLEETMLAKEIGMWVIGIRRGEHYIFGPTKKTKLLAGDYVIARGPTKSTKLLKRIAAGKLRRF